MLTETTVLQIMHWCLQTYQQNLKLVMFWICSNFNLHHKESGKFLNFTTGCKCFRKLWPSGDMHEYKSWDQRPNPATNYSILSWQGHIKSILWEIKTRRTSVYRSQKPSILFAYHLNHQKLSLVVQIWTGDERNNSQIKILIFILFYIYLYKASSITINAAYY